MKKFTVHYEGSVIVKANNEDEARREACLQGVFPDDIVKIDDYEQES